MLAYKVTLTINGAVFSPNKFLQIVDNDFYIFDQNEPKDLIWEDKSERYDLGSISIIKNAIFCLKNELDNHEKWYSNFLSKNSSLLKNLGVEQIIYNIDIFYTDFCSFELSCSENYQQHFNYDFSIPVNVFKVTEKEITEMLIENGYEIKFLQDYEW